MTWEFFNILRVRVDGSWGQAALIFIQKKIPSLENYNRTFACFLFPFLRSTLLRVIPKMSSTAVISFLGIVLVFGSLKCNANKTDLYILQMVQSDATVCRGMELAYNVAKNSSSFKSFFEKYEIKMNYPSILVSSQLTLWGRVWSFPFDKGRRHFCDILVRDWASRLRQTWDSSWEIFNVWNEQIKTA